MDVQIYEPTKPRPPRKKIDPAFFVPVHTRTPFYPPQFQYHGYPFSTYFQPNNVPVIKNYNIEVAGPTADHSKVSAIYEDILPSKQFANTMNTVGERITLYGFIRSIFVKEGDGEDVNLEGGNNSLMSYLKFMELNPYNSYPFSRNPYKGLPNDMMIYSSCYPIRYDKNAGTTQCAKGAIGLNVRIYNLTLGAYRVRADKQKNYYDYDVWRELAYYEYIREQIIKPKICPNFVLLHAYFLDEKCNIDFSKNENGKGENYQKILSNKQIVHH